jgi:hypothetical protein
MALRGNAFSTNKKSRFMIERFCAVRHRSLDVAGALKHTPDNNKKSWATDDDGRPLTNSEFRAALLEEAFKGRRVIPIGECDDFDYQTGCRGHGRYVVLHDWEWEEGQG